MPNHKKLEKILYVEDDQDINTIVSIALSTLGGFEVLSCVNDHEAIDQGSSFHPQLLLLDVMMPGMDEPGTLAKLREIKHLMDTPVVFITARVQERDVAYYRSLGAIGVIPKPFNPNTLADEIRAIWDSYSKPKTLDNYMQSLSLAEKLEEMARVFGTNLIKRLQALEQLWQPGGMDRERIDLAIREAHSLAGSGGTFGYINLTEQMRTLEQVLMAAKSSAGLESSELQDQLKQLMQRVRGNALLPQKTVTQMLGLNKSTNHKHSQPVERSRPIYFCDDDQALGQSLTQQLMQFGFEITYFDCLDDLVQAVSMALPAAIIMDIDFPEGRLAGIDRLNAVEAIGQHKIPMIYLSGHTDIWARLGAVRAGGQAYLLKPAETVDIVEQLDKMLDLQKKSAFRVMIVDDDPDSLAYSANVLESAGMSVCKLQDPMQMLTRIPDFIPEVILLDMYMPGVLGRELAAVIRQDPQLDSVPLIFLSSELDLNKQVQAISYGADDFVTKPVNADYLIGTISTKVLRYRKLRKLMTLDSLTGLLNHTHLLESLDFELLRYARHRKPLSFAMVDIDHFKQVNDTHGHPAGDRVIKSLSRLLRERLRKTDIIGRYGGEEFGVIMPDTTLRQAAEVMESIRISFEQMTQSGFNDEFHVTFSCGIVVQRDQRDTALVLSEKADKALYKAKHLGRNRVQYIDN